MKLLIPQGYKPKLGLRDTEVAIKKIKEVVILCCPSIITAVG